jgi:uncharacterized protein HemX
MPHIGLWEFCAVAAVLSTLGAAASAWLKHRREMVKMKLEGQAQRQNGGEAAELRQRLEALEKKCTEMQEQITDAHMLLADERRALDKKLAESFPEVAAGGSDARAKAPVRERI